VGTSFRRWAAVLEEEASAPSRVAEVELWQRVASARPLPLGSRPLDADRDTTATTRSLRLTLPTETTGPLLTTVPTGFRTGVQDVLLTGLALAVADRYGSPHVVLDVENHGREELAPSLYPVHLDLGGVDVTDALAAGPAADLAVARVAEHLRELPDHGLGYGLLRHLNPDTAAELAKLPAPAIGFNYLGRFTTPDPTGTTPWAFAPESAALGTGADSALAAAHVLEIGAVVHDTGNGPQLLAHWSWPDGVLAEPEVRALAESWFTALTSLVSRAGDTAGPSAADMTVAGMSRDELAELAAGLDS
jgi:non-ribosomal peptide synthase protein (TIGR01720 family)